LLETVQKERRIAESCPAKAIGMAHYILEGKGAKTKRISDTGWGREDFYDLNWKRRTR